MNVKELTTFLEKVPDDAIVFINTVTGITRADKDHDGFWRELESQYVRVECTPDLFRKESE